MAAHDRRIQAMAGSQLAQFYACASGTENTCGELGRIWLGRVPGTSRFRLSSIGRLEVDGQNCESPAARTMLINLTLSDSDRTGGDDTLDDG